MSSQLNISVPATLTVLAANATLSSLGALPPGISVTDTSTVGTLSVQLVAANPLAMLSASSLGGADVAGSGNTLSLSGTALQVNAALASLELTEPTGTTTDILSISASDPTMLPAQSALGVTVVAASGPAFVTPAQIVTLKPNALVALPDLFLSDPDAQGLAAMGLGQAETLSLTLSVAQGILFLPGLDQMSPLNATGIGTGTIEISFTADEISLFNAVMAGLEFAGPASQQHLQYTLWNMSGLLPREVTYGQTFLYTAGTAGASGTFNNGGQTAILGNTGLAGTLNVTGLTAVLGNLASTGTLVVAPDASLEISGTSLQLGGTSLDFGMLSGNTLVESGFLLAGTGVSMASGIYLKTSTELDFTGTLIADGNEKVDYDLAISLAQGAVLTGGGTITAGNFSESGRISGPGTIFARSGETLEIDAGLITGGTNLQVAGGGVMVLGELPSLFGVFNTTPLTVDSSVTLSFGEVSGLGVLGGYANTLGGGGGAFVITGPEVFSGVIQGFTIGDELIFPGLSQINIHNILQNSFTVSGVNDSGTLESYTLFTHVPLGLTPSAGVDAGGDPVVMLRPALASVTSGGEYVATSGVAQKLLGLSLNVIGSNTQSLRLTLSVGQGVITTEGISPASHITLTAANMADMNTALAGVTYTGTGVADQITFTSSTGLLAGLNNQFPINQAAPGVIDGYGGVAYSQGEFVTYSSIGGLVSISAPVAPGAVGVSGQMEFQGLMEAGGFSGTALTIDGGGQAIFAAAANVLLSGDIAVGDASGAGMLDVLTSAFSASGNLLLGGSAGADGSSAAVLGAATIAGAVQIGLGAASSLALDGSLSAATAILGGGGTLFAYGTAQAAFGGIVNQGSMALANTALLSAASYSGGGTLALGGQSDVILSGQMQEGAGGLVQIGTGAKLSAAALTQTGGRITDSGLLSITGTLNAGGAGISLAGGTLVTSSLALGGTLSGYGLVKAGSIADFGLIEAHGGKLLVAGSIGASAYLQVDAQAALELASGMSSGGGVAFAGAGALVTVDDVALGFGGVSGMIATDAIDLVGVAPSLVTYTGGTVAVLSSTGSQLAAFTLAAAAGQPAVSIVSDGAGGALLTLGGQLPCFARGTGLLTPHGYRAVEELRPGDPVITATGDRRPVRWVGWRTLDLAAPTARHARPVIIMPHAFGPGRPHKKLRLSPSHCVYADGVLIPVTHLVNHATILHDNAAAATYFHIELDRHDILLAEGLECESYFDDGNRDGLYRELGRRCPARKAFAPNVTTGPRLAAVRRRLHGIALAAGFSTTYTPSLRALAAGCSVVPHIAQSGRARQARLSFPAPVRELTLFAATATPADTNPDSEDRRELGICLGEMRGVRLGSGWQPRAPEDAGVWMGRVAELHLARARREILLPLAAIPQSWVKPKVDAARAGR